MRGKPDPVLLKMQERIVTDCKAVISAEKEAVKLDPSGELASPEVERAREELHDTLEELIRESRDNEFENTIRLIIGQVLSKRLTLEYIPTLNTALWELNQEKKDRELLRLTSYLKKKTCTIFRGALSGEEFYYRKNGEGQYYSLSMIPDRVRNKFGITYGISRVHTNKLLEAYDFLLTESARTRNEWMSKKWAIEKEVFLYLLKNFAHRLLEEPKETKEASEA